MPERKLATTVRGGSNLFLLQQPLGYHTNNGKAKEISVKQQLITLCLKYISATEKRVHCPQIKFYRRYTEQLQHDCFGGQLLQPLTEPKTPLHDEAEGMHLKAVIEIQSFQIRVVNLSVCLRLEEHSMWKRDRKATGAVISHLHLQLLPTPSFKCLLH